MLLCAVVGGGDTMSFPSSTSKRISVSGSSKSVSTVYGGRQTESPDSSISMAAATIAHLLVAQYDVADAMGPTRWQATRHSKAVDNLGAAGRGSQPGTPDQAAERADDQPVPGECAARR